MINWARFARTTLHYSEVEMEARNVISQKRTGRIEGIEWMAACSGQGRTTVCWCVVKDILQCRVGDERCTVPHVENGCVEGLKLIVSSQRPRGIAGITPETGRAPGTFSGERTAPVANDELSVLGFSVIGSDYIPRQ